MSDKTFQFHSRARREGFTQIDNPILRSQRLSAQAKVVWGLMCFYARQDESCYPGQELLAKQVPCSDRGLRNFITELSGVGLVEVVRRGLGKTNVYVLHDLDSLPGSAGDADQERIEVPPGSAPRADQERHDTPIPVTKKQETKKQETKRASGDAVSWPSTVNRQAVTQDEGRMALSILESWNAIAGQRLRAKSFLEKIVRRMREHPEVGPEEHERIIRAVLGGQKWWEGEPDPRIIYGSDGQFEACMARSVQTQPRSSVQSGRDWDEGMIS